MIYESLFQFKKCLIQAFKLFLVRDSFEICFMNEKQFETAKIMDASSQLHSKIGVVNHVLKTR